MVHEVKFFEILLFDVFLQLQVCFEDMRAHEGLGKELGSNREKFHLLGLVIYELCLLLFATDVFKLSSDNRVPQTG